MLRWRVLLVAIAVLFLGSSGAHALSLADLAAGGSFASDDGTLTFGSFDVVVTGSLSGDLDDYAVQTLDNGFRVIGPIGVADGFAGDLNITYEVTASPGFVVVGASLFFNGLAFGEGALASISEDFFFDSEVGEGPADAVLGVLATGAGVRETFDSVSFAPQEVIQSVLKDVQVSSVEGSAATISVIDQRYQVVPEPATLLLMGAGLSGLGLAGRRRHLRRSF